MLGITLLILIFGRIEILQGQDTNQEHQLWFDYNLKYKTSSDLAIGGDVGLRGFISNLDWNQYYIRPTLTFRDDYRLSFNAAIAYFRTDNKFSSNQNEFRL
jgi:hypothetical protein